MLNQPENAPQMRRPRQAIARLLADTSGNTMAMMAAAIVPILGLVGGAVDMSRSYLSETRLQQACDAGVLAARKRLGTSVVLDGNVPNEVGATGSMFFNANFKAGAYGTSNRTFSMTLESDLAISGVATVDVPTTVMRIFGSTKVPIKVECQSRLNFSNTDVMMVLDTTNSMNTINSGDTLPRIEVLKNVVTSFYNQLQGNAAPGTRIRYGFVPYSTNVNVGAVLQDSWVVDRWDYQSREDRGTSGGPIGTTSYTENWAPDPTAPGSVGPDTVVSTYPATYHPATTEYGAPWYTCDNALPASTYTGPETQIGATVTETYAGPPAGDKVTKHMVKVENGVYYWQGMIAGNMCQVSSRTYNNLKQTFDHITIPYQQQIPTWRYKAIRYDVSGWRAAGRTCMEERDTYKINNYAAVDFTQALDLNLDLVPTNQERTKWRPSYPQHIFEREIGYYGTGGAFNTATVDSQWSYFQPIITPHLVFCPSPVRKLAVTTPAELNTYLSALTVGGTTYHDIGMIWGGRLMSPTGLFASENADTPGRPTARHLIFLTDGQTEAFDIAYGAYGVEPLDRRRWDPATSVDSLNATVEKRFAVACNEVKRRNITVWVVAFGTTANPVMTACAGAQRTFQANNAAQLNAAFDRIATSMAELRISR